MRLNVIVLGLCLLLAAPVCGAQQVSLLGLRSLNHAGAFHSLKQDTAGNLYTLFDAHDGVRILKLSHDGTQVLAQAQLGQAGDTGIALALDPAGNIYVAGTSTSTGSVTGTAGTAFPARSDSTTNSFVARFSPALTVDWLSFTGSGKTAVTALDATANTVYVTGGIYANTLPVTSGGMQQTPAINSSANGFVEAFYGSNGTLDYATYLTGANGDTQPASIVANTNGTVYVVGTTTASGYPTTSALVPVLRYAGSSTVSGFVTRLTASGDGFLFSTFVPGSGLSSVSLDTSGAGALLLSGNISPGLFPLTNVQQPIANGLSYQSALRLSLDGSQVLSSTLLAPASSSVISAGVSGQSLIASSLLTTPLLPLQPLESIGTVAMFRVDNNGRVDRISRIGGVPINNSAYASIPVSIDRVLLQADGSIAMAGSVAPTLSSELLSTEHYDFPLVSAPNTGLPSTVRDALSLTTCNGSACSGSAAVLARLLPDATTPQLALSTDDHPNLTIRNLGPADATGLQVSSASYTVSSGCGTTLGAGAECSLALTGTSAGSITVQADNVPAFTTPLPATSRSARAITVAPHELDFGIVTASSPTMRTLTVRNLSSTLQTFASSRINTVSTAYSIAESSSCATTTDGTQKILPANSTCTITLTLTPLSSGSNDGPVSATWQVGDYEIPLTGYVQAATTSLSASTIDFGRQYVNGLRSARYLYVSNASNLPQSHITVSSTNPVFQVTDECASTLQPHSVCRIAMGYQSNTAPSSDALSLVVDGTNVTVLGETLPQPSIGGATVNPNLTVSATAVTFVDPVLTTTSSTTIQSVTIGDSGVAAFAVQIAVTGDFTQTSHCPAVLAGGASCSVSLTFTPSAPGLRQGLLAVSAGSASPVYIALSGTGTAILPQNNGVSFGDIPLNTPSVQWLKVQQGLVTATATAGNAAYNVVLVEDLGYGHGSPPVSSFSSTATGSCLNCWLGIQFKPVATGVNVSSISLSSSTTGKPTSVVVTGNGVPLSGVILTPLANDFGPVPVHSSSASTLFQLTNATSSDVSAGPGVVTGDFSITAETTGGMGCNGAEVAPGASCFLSIRFSPTAAGTRTGQLTVQTSTGTATTALAGTGSDDPGISFTPTEVRFDNVPDGTATQQRITVTNTSTTTATIGTPISSDAHFSATSGCSTLAPAASCAIAVSYVATPALSSGTVRIPVTTAPAGVAATTTYTVALTGSYTSESAGIQIIPGEHTTVNFGSEATDTLSASRILQVNNVSGKELAVSIAAPRSFSVTSTNCNHLAIGASCDLTVQFVPETAGSITGTVLLQGTPTNGSAIQNGLAYFEGYGAGTGHLAVSGNLSIQQVLPFGQVNSGQSASQTITLTNPTSASSTVTVRRIQSAAPFLTTTTCGQPLAPGQSCSVTVTYAPVFQIAGSTTLVAARVDTASITIESNAADAPQFVNLSGQVAPATAATAVDGEVLQTYSLSQGSLTFGSTAVGSSSAAQSIVLTNSGTAAVHVQQLIASSGFAATGNCTTVLPGTSCRIQVTHQPQAIGMTIGTLEIQSDAVASLELVTLVGTGGAASVSLSPQSLNFGNVLVGTSTSEGVVLTNTGTVAVTMIGVTVSGGDFALASSTTLAPPCPAVGGMLAAGASCSLTVAFKPSAAATIRGTLSVATSATPLPLTVQLSGIGVQPVLLATPTSLAFGNVVVGGSRTLSVTLRNAGSTPVSSLALSATQDFSVNSSCSAILTAGSSCSVAVTYSPTVTGNTTGTLTIRSTDPASPLLVPLTGTGVSTGSFLLTVNGGSSATVSVRQGVSASYSLSVVPINGYTGAVALTCTPDATVAFATCSVLPSTVTLSGSAQSSTATITTITEIAGLASPNDTHTPLALACVVPGLALLASLRQRRVVCALVVLCLGFFALGCGGGPDPHLRYVATGTYSFHVTASSINGTVASQSVPLTMVVTSKNQD